MKRLLIITAVLMSLVGCSNGSGGGLKEIKTSDLCVTHINLDANICYGDERKEVELITGSSEMEQSNFVSYLNDLNIIYRDARVVMIGLSEGSKEVYKALLDVQIGETRSNLKNTFGDNFNSDMPENELNYLFDVNNKQMLTKETLVDMKGIEDGENYLSLSISFDENGNAKRLYFSDWPALKYGM